jgi:hypothetical protein
MARILFICGTLNHTTQMHQIARELPEHDHFFTPYYCTGFLDLCRRWRLLEVTAAGFKLRARCMAYLEANRLPIDLEGKAGGYDLVLTASDLVIQRNIRDRPIVLIQEGMTDPENWLFHLVRFLHLPRLLAFSSSTTGLSHAYERFCVASEGYRDLFARKGVRADKLVVTGIPNFDDCERYRFNRFPHRDFVLACTSDLRETLRRDDRPAFIRWVQNIAAGRPIVFKLHPNEKFERATREIREHAPGALVYTDGNTEEMIANCETLVTQFSSCTYVGLALRKTVHTWLDLDELRQLLPLQNSAAARNIAAVCRQVLAECGATALLPERIAS